MSMKISSLISESTLATRSTQMSLIYSITQRVYQRGMSREYDLAPGERGNSSGRSLASVSNNI
jgi:hypothetical protein